MRASTVALGLVLSVGLVEPAEGQEPALAFPGRIDSTGSQAGVSVELDAEAVAALADAAAPRILLERVPSADGRLLNLALERVGIDTSRLELVVDGLPVAGGIYPSRLSTWRGRVVGSEDSEVFPGFSPTGTRGWVREGRRWSHFLASADAALAWRKPGCTVVSSER